MENIIHQRKRSNFAGTEHGKRGRKRVFCSRSDSFAETKGERGIFLQNHKFMSRYRGPRLRIIRRLGPLPGFTRKTATREAPPGQRSGAESRRKISQYAIRLQEKQKLRFNYGITESQLIRYVREARKVKGSTGEVLLQLLEMRLDNILFRLGFAPTIASARQAIRHGHILVNEKKATIPSYQCHQKDTIQISSKKRSQPLLDSWLERTDQWTIPPHLRIDQEAKVGVVNRTVDRPWVGLKLNELLIVEFYSRKL